jgi:hypothetical protein
LSFESAIAKAPRFFDEIIEAIEAEFRTDMQGDGYAAAVIDKVIATQRRAVAASRAELLAAVAASFSGRDGEPLN